MFRVYRLPALYLILPGLIFDIMTCQEKRQSVCVGVVDVFKFCRSAKLILSLQTEYFLHEAGICSKYLFYIILRDLQ